MPIQTLKLVTIIAEEILQERICKKILALGVPEVTDAAKTAINPDNVVWVVVGDRAKIEASIRELGLGEMKFLDADGNPVVR